VRGIPTTGCHYPEVARIEHLPPDHAGHPGFALAGTVGTAERAQTGFGSVAAVDRTKDIIGFVVLDHESLLQER
jgi:hypothetical protein